MTIHAARSGTWLVFVLAGPAAVGTREGSHRRRKFAFMAAAALAAVMIAIIRGPVPSGANPRMIATTIDLAGHSPILASDIAAEQIALAGGKVWFSDPIDAFQQRVQVAYLEWSDGLPAGLRAVGSSVRIVLVSRGSHESALMRRTSGFRAVAQDDEFELFERIPASG